MCFFFDKNQTYINSFDEIEVSSKALPAIFDTGSNVVIAPVEFASKFKNLLSTKNRKMNVLGVKLLKI